MSDCQVRRKSWYGIRGPCSCGSSSEQSDRALQTHPKLRTKFARAPSFRAARARIRSRRDQNQADVYRKERRDAEPALQRSQGLPAPLRRQSLALYQGGAASAEFCGRTLEAVVASAAFQLHRQNRSLLEIACP